MDAKFGRVSWSWRDVQSMREDWSKSECEDFLARIERNLQDRMIERGWEVIETELAYYED